jgi:signal transduction histidine kinase
MERGITLQGERGRLVREMHDGLGSLLVSTLALVEGGERRGAVIADALREVLDEMRLMLDSLEPDEDDLAALLGRVRARLAPRLVRAGLRVDWQVPVDVTLPALEPLTLHHVMRILQEAVGNVVRHAGATTISIRTRLEEDPSGVRGIALEIRDDGHGMSDGARTSPRGIAHMRKRTEEIQGRFEIESTDEGSAIRIWFPIERSSGAEIEAQAAAESEARLA